MLSCTVSMVMLRPREGAAVSGPVGGSRRSLDGGSLCPVNSMPGQNGPLALGTLSEPAVSTRQVRTSELNSSSVWTLAMVLKLQHFQEWALPGSQACRLGIRKTE